MISYNKIGFHCGPGGNPTGIGEYMRTLDKAGVPFAIKSVDHYGFCHEASQYTNANHVIAYRQQAVRDGGRHLDYPDYELAPDEAAKRHWKRTVESLPPEFNKRVWLGNSNEIAKWLSTHDVQQFGREGREPAKDPDGNTVYENCSWMGYFALENARLANAEGYRYAAFGWSAGEPEPWQWETPGMLAFLRYAAEHKDTVSLDLHEYSYDRKDIWRMKGVLLLRYREVYAVCDKHGLARPSIMIGEWGWEQDKVPGTREGMGDIASVAPEYAQDPDILAAFIWYLGVWSGNIANHAQPYISKVTEFSLQNSYTVKKAPDVKVPKVTPPPEDKKKSPKKKPPKTIKPIVLDLEEDDDDVQDGLQTLNQATLDLFLEGGFNTQAALYRALVAAGFHPIGPEVRADVAEGKYILQLGHRGYLAAVARVKIGEWDQVEVVTTEHIAALRAGSDEREGESKEAEQHALQEKQKREEAARDDKDLILEEKEDKELAVEESGFRLTHAPCGSKVITQVFGVNSERYKRFDLPGHNGIDLQVPVGEPYFAAAEGVVEKIGYSKDGYGYNIRIRCREDYLLLYAHARRDIPVEVGERVKAGDIIAYSGDTGNSTGPHLHFEMRHPSGLVGWPYNIIDPSNYLNDVLYKFKRPSDNLQRGYLWTKGIGKIKGDLALTTRGLNLRNKPNTAQTTRIFAVIPKGETVVLLSTEEVGEGYYLVEAPFPGRRIDQESKTLKPQGEQIDLAEYFFPPASGGRKMHILTNNEGGGEKVYTWSPKAGWWIQQKGPLAEIYFVDKNYIYLVLDTSPGLDQFYRVGKTPTFQKLAPYAKRFMRVGEVFVEPSPHYVKFFNRDGSDAHSPYTGFATNKNQLRKRMSHFEGLNGIQIEDVIEVGAPNHPHEVHFYAKGRGRVGWKWLHGHRDDNIRQSTISEIIDDKQSPERMRWPHVAKPWD